MSGAGEERRSSQRSVLRRHLCGAAQPLASPADVGGMRTKPPADESPAPISVFGAEPPAAAPELPDPSPELVDSGVAPAGGGEIPADPPHDRAGVAVPFDEIKATAPAPELPAAPEAFPVGSIGGAVVSLRAGRRVTRVGWNGRGMWLKLFTPDRDSDMTLPYVFMSTADGKLVPWLCSQTDLLADDWQELAQ